jgi:CheY-like chemotaxis protein
MTAMPANTQVLVVDDDDDVREAIRCVLEASGISVTTAIDGADALQQLRAGTQTRVILLDLLMPRMNGWEFIEAQLQDPSLAVIPVVVLTADAQAVRRPHVMRTAGLVEKPFCADTLVQTVKKQLALEHAPECY